MGGQDHLGRALALLGPLEQRVMRVVWSGSLVEPFLVRDVHLALGDLAYTTVMTTVNRLADKGVLRLEQIPRQKAYRYRVPADPQAFLAAESRSQVERLVERFGDAALAAFADVLDGLPAEQRLRLQRVLGH